MKNHDFTVVYCNVNFIKTIYGVEQGGGQLAQAKPGEPGSIMVSRDIPRHDLMRLLEAA